MLELPRSQRTNAPEFGGFASAGGSDDADEGREEV
jgi:hypothetical protein